MKAFKVGDVVLWRGIRLVVIAVEKGGWIEALSPTLRVHGEPEEFTHCKE